MQSLQTEQRKIFIALLINYTPFKEFMMIVNDSGTFNYTYIYDGENKLVARINPDGSKYFYHPDNLGSTSLITNETGEVVEDNYYMPYGLPMTDSAEIKLYENKEYSPELDQYYYGFRYYSPSMRLFLKADSILPNVYDPQQLNRYAFERNNPYIYVDEDGHAFFLYHGIGTSIGLAYLRDYSGALRSFVGTMLPDFNIEQEYYQKEFGLTNEEFHLGPESDTLTKERAEEITKSRAKDYVTTRDTRYLHVMGDKSHLEMPNAGPSSTFKERFSHYIEDLNPFLIYETAKNTIKYVGEAQSKSIEDKKEATRE